MLSISFYTSTGTINSIDISEKCYQIIADLGFSKKVKYEIKELTIEDEPGEIEVASLNEENRKILLSIIESARHLELVAFLKNLDDSPTIKEIRDSVEDIRSLTNLYTTMLNDKYVYVGFD